MDTEGAQHYVQCESCDNCAKFFCNTCYTGLCEHCQKEHLRDTNNRHHQVVKYQSRKVFPLETCKIHTGKDLDLCCKDCQIAICSKCLLENHKDHELDDIKSMYKEKLSLHIRNVSVIWSSIIPKCQELLEEIKKQKAACKIESSNILTDLKTAAKILHDQVDRSLSDLSENLRKIEKSILHELQSQERLIDAHVTYVTAIGDEYEQEILSRLPTEVISLEQPVPQLKEIPKISKSCLPVYVAGGINEDDIARQLGNVTKVTTWHDVSVATQEESISAANNIVKKDTTESSQPTLTPISTGEEVRQFKIRDLESVFHMSQLSSEHLWISDERGTLVKIDGRGNKLQFLSSCRSDYGYHTITGTQELLFSDRSMRSVNKLAADNMITRVITTGDWEPRSIYCSDQYGDVFVGMWRRGGAKLVKYDASFKEIQTIQCNDQGKPLYSLPYYITENSINRDIITSDYGLGAVVVVTKFGRYRFSYTGTSPKSKIYPRGVATDMSGRIIVCDSKASDARVHIIDKDGQFLSVITNAEDPAITEPRCLCKDYNQNLWLGQYNSGTVQVLKYPKNKTCD